MVHDNSKVCDIPVCLLNLERDKERLLFMQKQLNALKVEYRVIKAIDGQSLTEEQRKRYSKKQAKKCIRRELLPTEIGCSLSHAHIWELIISEQHKEILVLEDDIKIGTSLFQIIMNRHNLPKDYEFINFLTDAPQKEFGDFVVDIYKTSRHLHYANRTSAYLITAKGAKKLLNKTYPIRFPADEITGRTYLTGLVSYSILPAVAVSTNIKSSIDIMEDNKRINHFQNIMSRLKTTKDKTKWLILNWLMRKGLL